MSDVPCLFNPNHEPRPKPSRGAPSGGSRAVFDARRNITDFLDANLQRPLRGNNADRQAQLEQALDTMTPAERVWIEIDMQGQAQVTYSADYDPLPNR